MSVEPEFLLKEAVLYAHVRQLDLHGGAHGVRDVGMLESALGRAQNIWVYEQGSVPRMAAAYTYGIVRNHPFVDGNKRTGFVAGLMFLGLNGFDLQVSEAEACLTILNLAAGEIDEDQLTEWFTRNSVARSDQP